MKLNDIVKYSTPQKGEEGIRFILREINGDRVLVELICDWNIKPVENPYGDLRFRSVLDVAGYPRACTKCFRLSLPGQTDLCYGQRNVYREPNRTCYKLG